MTPEQTISHLVETQGLGFGGVFLLLAGMAMDEWTADKDHQHGLIGECVNYPFTDEIAETEWLHNRGELEGAEWLAYLDDCRKHNCRLAVAFGDFTGTFMSLRPASDSNLDDRHTGP